MDLTYKRINGGIYHTDWAVILVLWANLAPKEHALGEIPGGYHSEIARVHASDSPRQQGFTPARIDVSENLRQRGSIIVSYQFLY